MFILPVDERTNFLYGDLLVLPAQPCAQIGHVEDGQLHDRVDWRSEPELIDFRLRANCERRADLGFDVGPHQEKARDPRPQLDEGGDTEESEELIGRCTFSTFHGFAENEVVANIFWSKISYIYRLICTGFRARRVNCISFFVLIVWDIRVM